jgi:hypothetical protein
MTKLGKNAAKLINVHIKLCNAELFFINPGIPVIVKQYAVLSNYALARFCKACLFICPRK